MRALSENEIEAVGGGFDLATSAALTVGLMALAPASIAVITTGSVALAFYAVASAFK